MSIRAALSSVFGSLELSAPLLHFRVTRRSTAEIDQEALGELFGKLLLKYRWAFQLSPQSVSTTRQRAIFQRQTGGSPLPMSLTWQDEVVKAYQSSILSLAPEELWLPAVGHLVVDPASNDEGPITIDDLTAQISSLFTKAGLVCEQVSQSPEPVYYQLWRVESVKMASGLPVPSVLDAIGGALASGAATLFWAHNPPENKLGELNRVSLHIGIVNRESSSKARTAMDAGDALTIEPLGGLRRHEKAWRVVDFLGQEAGLVPVSLVPMTTTLHPQELDWQKSQIPVGTADGFPQVFDIARNTLILAEPGSYEGIAMLQLGAIHAVSCGLQVLLITPPAADNRFLQIVQALNPDCPIRVYTTEDFQSVEWPPLGGSGGPVLNLLTPATRDTNASQVVHSVLKDLPERGGRWWVGVFEFAARTPEDVAHSGRPISAAMPMRQAHMEAVQALILEGPPQGVIVAYRSDAFTLDANSGMMARAKDGLQDIWAFPGPSARYLRVFMYPEDKVFELQPKLGGAGRELLAGFQPWRKPPRLVDLREGPLAGPLFNPSQPSLWQASTWPAALPQPDALVESAGVRTEARQRYFAPDLPHDFSAVEPVEAPVGSAAATESEIEALATPEEFAALSRRLQQEGVSRLRFGPNTYRAKQFAQRGFRVDEVEELIRQGVPWNRALEDYLSAAEVAAQGKSEAQVPVPEEPQEPVIADSQSALEKGPAKGRQLQPESTGAVEEPEPIPERVVDAPVVEVSAGELRKELNALGLNAKQVREILAQMNPAGVQQSLGNGWRKKHWLMYLRGEEPTIIDLAAMTAMAARARS